MIFNAFTISSLFLAVLAAAEPRPYKLGQMSVNEALALLDKRQAGYSPTQTYCSPGSTCEVACGPTFIQCDSTDGNLHCYDPTVKQSCCPDGTGNSCDDGYFCTSDTSGGTWCCPDGMSLSACAAAYSLTGPLFSETSTAAPSTTSTPSSSPASATVVSTTVTPTTKTTPTTTSTPTATKTPGGGVGTVSIMSSKTSTSSAPPLQVTNAAAGMKVGGLGGLALVAGGLLVL